jgi:hypothetical protein
LRNKIEHRHIDKHDLDVLIFGECQALLYNYETFLTKIFGIEYSINENLVYSLQFSTLRTEEQKIASKRALSIEVEDIKKYVETYRTSLPEDIYNSQSYSIKLIQVPKISNTNRNDLAIQFVKWDELNDDDKLAYQKITAIIKEKIIKQEAVNVNRHKPAWILNKVKKETGVELSHHDHRCLYTIFNIRPDPMAAFRDPFETNSKYCLYDEVHHDYVYTDEWADCLKKIVNAKKMQKYLWQNAYKQKRQYPIEKYI